MAIFGGYKPNTLEETKRQRKTQQELMAQALMQGSAIAPGEPEAKAWQPFAQMLVGKLGDKRLAGQENELQERYRQTLAKALAPGSSLDDTMAALAENPDTADTALKIKLSQAGMKPNQLPSSVQEWNFYNSLSEADQKRYLEMKRQLYSVGDIGGVPSLRPHTPGIAPIPLSTLGAEASGKATIAGAEARAKEAGKSQAEAESQLPTQEASAAKTMSDVDALLKHPGLSYSVGRWSLVPDVAFAGTPRAEFVARYNQLKGTAFLQAYQMLKGGGQITEIEGKKAEDAMARMDRAQDEAAFRTALTDFRDAVDTGFKKLQQKAGREPTGVPQKPSQTGTVKFLGFEGEQ